MPSILGVLGGLFALWYVVVWFFATWQEFGVGWTRFDRKARMAFFIAGMEIGGSVQQVAQTLLQW